MQMTFARWEKGKTMRPIDADALMKNWERDRGRMFDADYFIFTIEHAPTIDAVPVRHGRWEDYEENTWQCSECGEPFYLEDGTPQENEYNYCPYCGAKMDKENKDEL